MNIALYRPTRPDIIARWLLLVAAMVLFMVIVGGITRLTESGLSITEWKPITGAIPPLNDDDWQHAFALYKGTTEYQTVNRAMTLAEFKQIFFWEWFHRLLGRLIGLAFALPLVWFAVKRWIPAGFGWRLVGLLLLGVMQGAIGWWMVKSGLVGRDDVSHYRLAVHLLMAFTIIGALVWTAMDMRDLARNPASRKARLTRGAALALGLLAIQLLWGAYTAGLNAGFAFASWPLMGDELFPSNVPMSTPWIANLVDNPIVVQFIHRWWAFVAAGALIWLGIRAMRSGARGLGAFLHIGVLVQISLGIATLLTGVQIWIAVAHQGVAGLLVAVAAACAQRVGRRVA